MNIKLIKKGDIILAVAVLAVCGVLLLAGRLAQPKALMAVITVNGEIYEEIDLSSLTQELIIEPGTSPAVTIRAAKGAICFLHADCPDKLCVHSGELSRAGAVAACLPAKAVITVIGSGAVDAVTY